MNNLKSHITFTKQQRYGIFLLLTIIILLQGLYFYITLPPEKIDVDKASLQHFQAEMDSLRQQVLQESKPKIYPFNPNYITDFKGYTLGMSNVEIDKLLAYRKQDKWINSAEDFQSVTGVSDALLQKLSPYFKFPDWVNQSNSKKKVQHNNQNRPLAFKDKLDLNTATSNQLQKVYGVGEKLAERIVRFRASFDGGFIADVQLQDVYGLTPEVIENITKQFTVKTPRVVEKLNLNEVNVEDLVKIPHIDYPLAHDIIEARILRDGFNSLNELLKVKNFPSQKVDIIKLYLKLN